MNVTEAREVARRFSPFQPASWPMAETAGEALQVLDKEVEKLRAERDDWIAHFERYNYDLANQLKREHEEKCDHPWHNNPGLIIDCPQCSRDAAGGE